MTRIPSRDLRPFWRRYFWAILFGFVLVGGNFFAQVRIEFTVTEEEAQAHLDAQLEKFLASHPDYDITYVEIDFHDDDMSLYAAGGREIFVRNLESQRIYGQVSGVGEPDYRKGSIYFNASDFELEEFLINEQLPSEVAERLITETADVVAPQLRDNVLENEQVQNILGTLGVTIDREQNDEAISSAALFAQGLMEEYRGEGKKLLENMVLQFLETTPLYTLGRNWKEQVLLAALEDIEIKDGVFTATLTGAQVLRTLIAALLSFVVAVCWIVALMRGNGAGLGLVVLMTGID